MYLGLLATMIIAKPPPHSVPPEDVWMVNPILAMVVLVLLVLVAFGLGATLSWFLMNKRKQAITNTPMPPSLAAENPSPLGRNVLSQNGTYFSPNQSISSPVRTPSSAENPLENRRWLQLTEECVSLFNELETIAPTVDAASQDMLHHVEYRLQEILTRSKVEMIAHDTTYNVRRHLAVPPDPDIAPGTPIVETISPGFVVNGLVLRPARVRTVQAAKQRDMTKEEH